MSRKRVRGLKRHLRNHQQWATIPVPFDEERIRTWQYNYKKLGLTPWRVSEKPPAIIRKLWVGRLVADYQRWHEQLAARHTDFYLAVWIFDPGFGNSQLVAGAKDRKIHYDRCFGEPLEMPLPPEYHSLPGIHDLKWTAKAHILPYRPKEFAELGAWGSKKPHWLVEPEQGEPLVAVQVGVVWVGQKHS